MIATVDVVVVGAGPAGAVAALNLARGRTVLLVERHDRVVRIGESLVPAARRLLADMGLLAALEAGGHAPWFGNHVSWGRRLPARPRRPRLAPRPRPLRDLAAAGGGRARGPARARQRG